MLIANAIHKGHRKVVALQADGNCIDLTAALLARESGSLGTQAASIQSLLDSGRFEVPLLAETVNWIQKRGSDKCILPLSECRLLAPFERPGQIIALARNYSDHAKESTLPPPHEPIFFSKANTSVVGPEEPIVLPPNLGRVEPEIELAFIIKKEASHVPVSLAADYIAGYTILNDVSAQELQAREIQERYPLFRCKSLKTFTPMGPWLATVDEIGTEPALAMTLRVNDEVRVTTNTRGLTFGIARLLEFVSGYVFLCPGDVVTTGCPKAAGAIHPGDVVSLEIEKLGNLRNPVVAGKELCPA
jgi:2-keto-4-pentenoate hydratase/2-oxohepta-3-ene-1,7-dioic acid hydratase in catechol pathway